MVLSVPMGEGEERSSFDRAPNLAHVSARAVAGISVLLRGMHTSGAHARRFKPAAEQAYNDLVDFLELANNWFSKFDAELPDVEDDYQQDEAGG